MLNERHGTLGRILLLALLWTSPPAHAAPADETADSGSSEAGSTTEPRGTAAPTTKPQPPPRDPTNAKESDEFNPSESLSEDATVAYPVDI